MLEYTLFVFNKPHLVFDTTYSTTIAIECHTLAYASKKNQGKSIMDMAKIVWFFNEIGPI